MHPVKSAVIALTTVTSDSEIDGVLYQIMNEKKC